MIVVSRLWKAAGSVNVCMQSEAKIPGLLSN